MRELKFRVWDKNKKEWWSYENKAYLNVSLTFDGRPLFWTGDECRFEGKIWPEEWVVQQFTGLKDKNGKEIYEGDFVLWLELPYMSNEEVNNWVGQGKPTIEKMRIVREVKWYKYKFTPFYDHLGGSLPEKGEVIGNIFQNL